MPNDHAHDAEADEAPPVFHATGVNITGTAWTLSLLISESSATQPGAAGAPVPQPTDCVVTMSWPLAKALSEILAATITSYEHSEATIQLPRSFVERANAAIEAAKTGKQ